MALGSRRLSKRFQIAIIVTMIFVVVEAVAGWYSNSLALLSDAAHNFTDVLALGLSFYAIVISARPSTPTKTYGYHRAGILAALVNASMLLGIAFLIFYEGYQRLTAPPEVQEDVMTVVAAFGFIANAGVAIALHGASAHDLNVRSAFVHMAADAASTLGVVIAGLVIAWTGWSAIDAIASILIGAMIAWSSWSILREGIHILLEGTPRGIDLNAMLHDLMQVPGVRSVHDLHAWTIASDMHALSAHVVTDDISLSHGAAIQRDINRVLVERYNIAHTALQLECEGCNPDAMYCELGNGSGLKNTEHR